jgi:hypothetical protein
MIVKIKIKGIRGEHDRDVKESRTGSNGEYNCSVLWEKQTSIAWRGGKRQACWTVRMSNQWRYECKSASTVRDVRPPGLEDPHSEKAGNIYEYLQRLQLAQEWASFVMEGFTFLPAVHMLLAWRLGWEVHIARMGYTRRSKQKSYPCNRPWRPIGLWDVKNPTLSRQSAHS